MNPDTILYVTRKQRLTRRESQGATRERLIAAAEKSFVRHGFDASSVEQIAEGAGFSRGAFYSNFRNKDELFIEVLKSKRREVESALDEIVRQEANPAKRLRAVLDWYVNQSANRGWAVLESEFMLRAFRNRAARSRLSEFNRQRIADYSALVARHFAETGMTPDGGADVLAVALFVAGKGTVELAMLDPDGDSQTLYASCRDLVFNRLIPSADK